MISKQLNWFIHFISMYSFFMNLETWLVHNIYDHNLPKSFKSPINLPCISVNMLNVRLVDPIFLEIYIVLFKNSSIWLAESVFDPTWFKKFWIIFLQSTSACKKSRWLIQLVLSYSWFQNPEVRLAKNILEHSQLKFYKQSFTFLESISASNKSSLNIIL